MGHDIVVKTQQQLGLTFKVWPAAIALCEYIVDHLDALSLSLRCQPQELPHTGALSLQGIRTLELGSGPGLCGILAARLGSQSFLTDLPCALPNLAETIQKNLSLESDNKETNKCLFLPFRGSAEARKLVWGDSLPDWISSMDEHTPKEQPLFDLVLATDCIYDQQLFPLLLRTIADLKALSHSRGKPITFLMANVRRWKNEERFWKKLRKIIPEIELVKSFTIFSEEEGGKKQMRIFRVSFHPQKHINK